MPLIPKSSPQQPGQPAPPAPPGHSCRPFQSYRPLPHCKANSSFHTFKSSRKPLVIRVSSKLTHLSLQRQVKLPYVLFLTPFLKNIPSELAICPGMDPFEPTARSLLYYYSSVRHVPYIVSDGLREIHYHLISGAGLVIVIAGQQEPGNHKLDAVTMRQTQEKTIASISKMTQNLDIPSVVVTVGEYHLAEDELRLLKWSELDNLAKIIYNSGRYHI